MVVSDKEKNELIKKNNLKIITNFKKEKVWEDDHMYCKVNYEYEQNGAKSRQRYLGEKKIKKACNSLTRYKHDIVKTMLRGKNNLKSYYLYIKQQDLVVSEYVKEREDLY